MNKQFSELSSFSADVHNIVDGQETTDTLFYKFRSKYKLVNKDGGWSLFDGLGIFLHYDKERLGIIKIDTNKLSENEKIKFYGKIPPFPGIFLSKMLRKNINFKGIEMDEGRELSHFEASEGYRGSLNFWVDKKTGILMKYIDSNGTKWSLSNLRLNAEISDEELFYLPADNIKIIDITETFKN